MSPVAAIGVVALGLLGCCCVVASLPVFRRPRLGARLDVYLGALGPRRSPLLAPDVTPEGALRAALRPLVDGLGRRLQRMLRDDGTDLDARLAAAASDSTAAEFRARQVTWGIGGFTVATVGAFALVAAGRAVSAPAVIVAAIAFGAGGVILCDNRLSRAGERRRSAIVAEFPTFVDLVCLAVTAGESLRGALELVATGSGPLATEIRGALREARAGGQLSASLDQRARRLGVVPLERFVASVVTAQERGIPLADSLRAMAFDVRENEKRNVIEAGGRKQISMLMPVVGLMLPVAIVFAFYPGIVAIRTLAH